MPMSWHTLYAERTTGMASSDIRHAFRLAENPEVISFAGGFPGIDSFPAREVAEMAALVDRHPQALQYGATEGFHALRDWVAGHLADQGINVDADQVLITHGSQQALDLLARTFVNPGDPVAVELPTYLGGLSAFRTYQAGFIGIPLDEDGMQVDVLAAELRDRRQAGSPLPKFIYTVPNFQNPSGVTLSLARRLQLLQVAAEFDIGIVEDDPYGGLRFEGTSVPALQQLDTDGRVLYLGTFSKTLVPGVRVGWVAGPREVIAQLGVAKQAADLCTGSLGQHIALECARRGLLTQRLPGLRDFYRIRRDAMLAALDQYAPPGIHWTRPEGGFFIWMTLPPGMDARALLPAAVATRQVAYVSGSAFFADGQGANTLRLAYSQADPEVITEGISRLGEFLQQEVPIAGRT